MMKTPEQLKGAIRTLAKKKGIHAQGERNGRKEILKNFLQTPSLSLLPKDL